MEKKRKLKPGRKEILLNLWVTGDKSLTEIGQRLGIPTKKVRPLLGIPEWGSNGIFQFKLELLAPHLRVASIDEKLTSSGNKHVYLTFLDSRDNSEYTMISGDLISALKADPNRTFGKKLKEDKEVMVPQNLPELLKGKTEDEIDMVYRWAKGESMSSIAKKYKKSRGRLAMSLGLPATYSLEAFTIRLEVLAPHLEVISAQNSDTSKDIILLCKDARNNREWKHPASFVLNQVQKDPDFIFFPDYEEMMNRREKKGTARLIGGMSIRQYAKKIGSSYGTVSVALQERTEAEAIKLLQDYSPKSWTLENRVARWLEEWGLDLVRDRKLAGTSYRPDIVVHDKKLIVECDGLFWHCDAMIKDKKYHQKKREAYLEQGYRSFFFREDELNNKPEVCKSILANYLRINSRVFARKTSIIEDSPHLFADHHMMGKGQGTVYSLVYQEKVVASMQVKFKSKAAGLLDISRFCSAPGISVVGGFSKLISHAIKEKSPRVVQTFIDLRYGDGSYLKRLGWYLDGSRLSFSWTDGRGKTFHRMKYPRKSGYDQGLFKLWDCGQAKWVLDV